MSTITAALEAIGVTIKDPLFLEDVSDALDQQEAKLRMIAVLAETEQNRCDLDGIIDLVNQANEKLKSLLYG